MWRRKSPVREKATPAPCPWPGRTTFDDMSFTSPDLRHYHVHRFPGRWRRQGPEQPSLPHPSVVPGLALVFALPPGPRARGDTQAGKWGHDGAPAFAEMAGSDLGYCALAARKARAARAKTPSNAKLTR